MTPDVMSLLQSAVGALQARDYARALSLADQALGKSPGDVEALHLQALALGKLGRIDDAEKAYRRAARVHPQPHAVLSNFGNALAAAGRTEEAISAYRDALAAAPGFVDAWINLASALSGAGRRKEAREALERAVALAPGNVRALNNLGTALVAEGRREEGIAAFTRALERQPDFAFALINRGAALRDESRFEESLRDLKRGVEIAPRLAQAHVQLAALHRILGEAAAAEAAYRDALRVDPASLSAHRELASLMFEQGRDGDFCVALDAAIAASPSLDLLDLKADLATPAGDIDAAEAAARRMIELAPDDARGHRRYARVRRARRDFSTALAHAARAGEIAPDDWPTLFEHAEALLAAGRPAQAAELLDRTSPVEETQRRIALLSLAMRAAGDNRYRRYYDYDRFATRLMIEIPAGYETLAAFNDELFKALAPMHAGRAQRPVDQTLYGGTQTVGRLWDSPIPVIRTLKNALMDAARRYVRALPDDPEHPFLARKSEDLDCQGAWSVMLASGGGHVDHFHPKGWISASYYVKVPAEVSASDKAGHLRLGGSGVDGLALPAERWIEPIEGSVIIFPSYMWHGVEPFVSTAPRVTAPYDLAPRLNP